MRRRCRPKARGRVTKTIPPINTLRDLVGVDFKPAEGFPADDVGYGFDNSGDVLSISPFF